MTATVIDRASELITSVRGKALDVQQREKPVLWERAQELFAAATADNRAMNSDESARYDELTGLIADINEREQQTSKHERMERGLAAVRQDPSALGGEERTTGHEQRAAYAKAFDRYLRYGSREMEREERDLLRTGLVANAENRAQATAPGSAGGYLIPTTFQSTIEETMKWFGGIDEFGHESLNTAGGGDIEIPTNDDTANVGRLVTENGPISSTDLSFGQKVARAYLYSSDFVKVSIALLQDEGVQLEAFAGRKLAERLGRIRNTHLTTGDAAAKPQGIVTGAGAGVTAASATAVTYNELIDLEHTVDRAYRRAELGCGYMFADATFKALRKLADSQLRPLWVPWLGSGVAGAVPATFNGWNYTINNDMAAMATGLRSILFGSGKDGYLVRTVAQMSLIRVEERFIDNGQVAFLLFSRFDGLVVDQTGLRVLTQA